MARRNRRNRGQQPVGVQLPREYQFDLPKFPGVGGKPHYRAQASGDLSLAQKLYQNSLDAQARQLGDTANEDLGRAADIWGRFQQEVAPLGGQLSSANTAITDQLTGALGQVYGATPTAANGGLPGENALGQSAVATGGTGQLGLLGNIAAAQQGMQAGIQREGAVDATDMARHILADKEAGIKELAMQGADWARTIPDQLASRLADLRSQGQSQALQRYQLALNAKQTLAQMASDQAYSEMMQRLAAQDAAKKAMGRGAGETRAFAGGSEPHRIVGPALAGIRSRRPRNAAQWAAGHGWG